jgi:DnaJ-domain-containing protein 1
MTLTPTIVEELTGSNGIKAPGARLLLLLCWHFASRVGDMRQVRVSDVVLRDAPSSVAERVLVRITFRRGKVSTITGPVTLVAYVPKRVASAIVEYKRGKAAAEDMFSLRNQAELSARVRALKPVNGRKFTLLSIRRGALVHLAQAGVSDEDLQALSGHRRRETLMRYLGWGLESSTAIQAAARRAKKTPVVGGADGAVLHESMQPPKMGAFSGFLGRQGKRVHAQPRFFPIKPPSSEECGVTRPPLESAMYPLHIKDTSRVRWDAIEALARGTPLAGPVSIGRSWCESDTLHGMPYDPVASGARHAGRLARAPPGPSYC